MKKPNANSNVMTSMNQAENQTSIENQTSMNQLEPASMQLELK